MKGDRMKMVRDMTILKDLMIMQGMDDRESRGKKIQSVMGKK